MQCQCNARGPLSKLERAPPQRKINVTSKSPVGDISVVTLIRTDTTLDHSQKAEKVCIDISATFVEPRKCIFSSSFTSREASTSRVAHSTFVCFTQPHCLHLSRRARDGAGAWIPGGLNHSSHRIKPPCFVGPKPAMPVGGDAAKKKRLDSTMCAALVHSESSASSTLSLRSVNSSQTARQHIHRRAQRWANKFMHLSNLGKSASKLSSAINPRCNSNICNCCSLGRCKDNAETNAIGNMRIYRRRAFISVVDFRARCLLLVLRAGEHCLRGDGLER